MSEIWLLWQDEIHSPWMNMAIDEQLMSVVEYEKKPFLRIYRWDRQAASIGFAQKWGIVPPPYTVVRRLTGGGVVYHDIDLTYTLVFPNQHPLAELSREESYAKIHQALSNHLDQQGFHVSLLNQNQNQTEHSSMKCFVSPSRHDVMIDHQKFAGAAQRRNKLGVLHQGSVILSLIKKSSEETAIFVKEAFHDQFGIQYQTWTPSTEFFEQASLLAKNKYQSELWNKHRRYTEGQSK